MRHVPEQKQTVCVVVPIYRAHLEAYEAVALERCLTVLARHPIILAQPAGLDMRSLLQRHPRVQQEIFPDEYFEGVAGYNRMMLSDDFYARFTHYEFMLVHQLDAFVFSDQLLHWCAQNYDYVGAPWIPEARKPTLQVRLRAALHRKFYRLIDRQYSDRAPGHTHWAQFHYAAGNGGFSLRRVNKIRKVLAVLHEQAEGYRSRKRQPWAEDIFFSVEANRYRRHLQIPGLRKAALFSWEQHPAIAAQLTGGILPFGCHAWDKYYRDDWRPIFARLGYALDELLDGHT